MAHKIRLHGPWSWLPEAAPPENSANPTISEPAAPTSAATVRLKLPTTVDALPASSGILQRNFQWPSDNPTVMAKIVIEAPQITIKDLWINDLTVSLQEVNHCLVGEISAFEGANKLSIVYQSLLSQNPGIEIRELVWKELRLELTEA